MKVSDVFASKYLSANDLKGRTYQLTIAGIQIEELDGQGGKKTKPVLFFQGAQKGMVLNRTNAEAISVVLGDETNDWIGHKLELFSMRVQGPNGMTDGLRCRVILPQNGHAPAAPAPVAAPLPPRALPGNPAPVLDDDIPF